MYRHACVLLMIGVILFTGVCGGKDGGRRRNFGGRGGKQCKNRQFQRSHRDRFLYSAVVENGLQGTTNNISTMHLKAIVFVSNADGCEFFMKLANVTLTEKISNKDPIPLTSTDFVKRLTANGLRFSMQNGNVTALKPSSGSTEPDVLNIQRGILSMLQGKLRKGSRGIEDDVSGSCVTEYRYFRGGQIVDKVKDLSTCQDHKISHSSIDGIPIHSQDPLLKSSSICTYKTDISRRSRKSRKGLKSVSCREHFLVRPFSSELGAGAYVRTTANLTRMGSVKIAKGVKVFPYERHYTTTIKYDSSREHTDAYNPSFRGKVTSIMKRLSQQEYSQSKFTSAEKFFELVASLRRLNSDDIKIIIKDLDMDKEAVQSFLFDGLAQCGTPHCLGTLFALLQKNNMMEKLPELLPFLAFTKEPSPQVIRLLMQMRQQQKNPSLVLLISTLVYRMCQHRPGECDRTGSIYAKIVQDVEADMLRLLGNDCSTKDEALQKNIYYALKGIGNMGRPTKSIRLIHDCIENAELVYISVAAIQAFRRMSLTPSDRYKFQEMLTNKNQDLEKRVELFMMLMKNATREDIILARDLANSDDDSSQLRSFIYSYLTSTVNNPDPTDPRRQMKFRDVLAQYYLNPFNPSATRYSKAFTKYLDLYRFGAAASGMSLFHPESFLPRRVNLNLTANMFGYSVNPLEIDARMEGLEMVLPKYFGKDGYFSESYVKKLFEIPKEKLEKRKRRSILSDSGLFDLISDVNMRRNVTPDAMISLKIFGNEVQLLSLNDLPFLKGELGNRNIIKDLYELTKGRQKTFKKNLVLLEVSHSVPTVIGLPLKVALNVSAVLTVDVKGKIVTKNLFIGPKAATVEGSVKPSISMHASGKVGTTCLGYGRIGTSFQANLLAAKELSGKVDYEEGKEVVFELNAEKDIKDVVNVSYGIFHETTHQRKTINGASKRAKGRFCTGDYFNTSSVFGSNMCMEIDLPVSYYNLSVPYFPLSGPFSLGVRDFPVDPLLTKYRMVVKKDADVYTASISTPGTQIERNYEVYVGSSAEGNWTMGFLYGKEREGMKRKGMSFSALYDQETGETKLNFATNIQYHPYPNPPVPVEFEAHLFNETNEETLGRRLGGTVKLVLDNFYSQHTIYYQQNYEFWAVGARFDYIGFKQMRFEYQRDRVAEVVLKGEYEPQVISLLINHPSTNTKFYLYGMPNMPQFQVGANMTFGEDSEFITYGKLDFERYVAEGYVGIQPMDYQNNAKVRLFPAQKKLQVYGDDNGVPWIVSMTLKNTSDHNLLETEITVGNERGSGQYRWNSTMVKGFLNFREFNAFFQVNLTLSAGALQEVGKITYNGKTTTYHYNLKNTTDKTETCITGIVADTAVFGTCVDVYTSNSKKGIVTRMKNPVSGGSWSEFETASFLMNIGEDGTLTAHYRILDFDKLMKNITDSHIVNLVYTMAEGEILFNANVMDFAASLMIAEKFGKGKKQLKMRYGDGVVAEQLFDMSLTFNELVKVSGSYKDRYDLSVKAGNTHLQAFAVYNDIDRKFNHEFGYVFQGHEKIGDSRYTLVLKDKSLVSSAVAPVLIMDFDTEGNYLSGIEYIPKKNSTMVPVKLTRVITDNLYTSSLQTKKCPECGGEYVERLLYVFDKSRDTVSHKLKTRDLPNVVQMYKDMYFPNNIKMFSAQFAGLSGVKRATVQNIVNLLLNGTIEYFTAPYCNAKDIDTKYISGLLNTTIVGDVLVQVLTRPFNPMIIGLIKGHGDQNNMSVSGLVSFLKDGSKIVDKSMFYVVMQAIRDKLASQKFRYQGLVDDILKRYKKVFKPRDTFTNKFVDYMMLFSNDLFKIYTQKLDSIDVERDLKDVLVYIPGNIKPRFIGVLKKTISALKNWRYKMTLTPFQNLENLKGKLTQANFHELFLLDYEHVIIKAVFRHIELPKMVEVAVLEFMKNSDYKQLFSRMTKFMFTKYGVKKPDKHVRDLMKAVSFADYTTKFAEVIAKSPDVDPSNKAPFQQYITTNKVDKLFSQMKDGLKANYGVSDTSLELLDELFSNIDMKTFSLKDLPTMLAPVGIPKLLKNFIIFLKKSDVYGLAVKVIKRALPEIAEVVDELIKLVEGNGNLNEVLFGAYKIVIQSVEKFVEDFDTEEVTKYVKMFLVDKNLLANLKKMMLSFYDKTTIPQSDQIPDAMRKDLEGLKLKIRGHLDSLDVELLSKNTTLALLNLFNGILQEAIKYSDEQFRAGFRGLIAQLPNLIMSKLLKNGEFLEQYDAYVEQSKAIIQMVSNSLDEMIYEQNGTFSIVAVTTKIVQAFSSSDAVRALLANLDVRKYANLTYDVFMEDIEKFFDTIGSIEHGNKTINQHVQGFLYESKWKMQDAYYGFVNNTIQKYVLSQQQGKIMFSDFFNMLRGYVAQAQMADNKLFNFAVDVLIPGIDGLFLMENSGRGRSRKHRTADVNGPYAADVSGTYGREAYPTYDKEAYATYDRNPAFEEYPIYEERVSDLDPCLLTFMGQWGPPPTEVNSTTNYTFARRGTYPEYLKRKLVEYRKSASCDIATLPDTIEKMKKDKYFILNFLNKIESILLKGIDENLKTAKEWEELLEFAMVGEGIFEDDYDQNVGLGKILFSIGDKIVSLLNKPEMFQKIARQLKMQYGDISFKNLMEKYVLKYLQTLPYAVSFPIRMMDRFGNKYVLPTYIEMKTKFHNISTIIKTATNYITERFNQFTNPKTGGIMQLFPETMSNRLEMSYQKSKNSLISLIYTIERKIREAHVVAKEMFQKYRREMRSQLGKLQGIIRKFINTYLDTALKYLERFQTRVTKVTRQLKFDEWDQLSMQEKLANLTKKTMDMREKYAIMKEKFLTRMSKDVYKRLKGMKWMHINKDLVMSMLKDLNIDVLNMLIANIHKSPKQILRQGVNVVLRKVVQYFKVLDKKVCALKRQAYKVVKYNSKDGSLTVNLNLKFLKPLERIPFMMMKNDRGAVMELKRYSEIFNLAGWHEASYSFLRRIFERTLVRYLNWVFAYYADMTKYQNDLIINAVKMNAYFADQQPDVMIKGLLRKYDGQIKYIAKMMDDVSIDLPAFIELPVIQLFGAQREQKSEMFVPLSRTAYLFTRSLVTYDGKAVVLPRDLLGKYYSCKFLLTHDFLRNQFTMYLHRGSFVVELADVKITVPIAKPEVNVFPKMKTRRVPDFPLRVISTTIARLPSDVVEIKNAIGLVIYCHLRPFSCNVTVPGYYHNKTLGLFGTNNAEYSDDFRMPNGQLAEDPFELLNAFEVTTDPKCSVKNQGDIFDVMPTFSPECSRARLEPIDPRNILSPTMGRFRYLREEAFRRACRHEDACSVFKSYASSSYSEYGVTYDGGIVPEHCGCPEEPKNLIFGGSGKKPYVQITLLLKLVPEIERVKATLRETLKKVDVKFSKFVSINYTVIGFGGEDVFKEPHIQTLSGETIYDIDGALRAIDQMQFYGKKKNEKLGVSALQFAAPIQLKSGTRIFILFENEATYTNLLQQMIDVSGALNDYGIVLNVVNNYRMKLNVIAKDSYRKRYHVNKPDGEEFSSRVSFPPTDDYIPYVTQTKGAVFRLKAFTTDDPSWSRALPVSLYEVLKNQIDQDLMQCKECKCSVCKNVPEIQCRGPFYLR